MLPFSLRARARVGGPILDALLGSDGIRRRLARKRALAVEGHCLDEHLAAALRLDDVTGDSVIIRRAPNAARVALLGSVLLADAGAPSDVVTEDVAWSGPKGTRPARVYTPPDLAAPSPGVVFLHGGGFVTGDLDTHDGLCRRLAAFGRLRVIAIDYRLAPDHPFPAAAEDAVAAFRWCAQEAALLGVDPARLAVAGDSAGGNLSAVVARRCAGQAVAPVLAILLYPALDATCVEPSHQSFADGWMLTGASIDWYYDHYFGAQRLGVGDPDASPLLAPVPSGHCRTWVHPCHFDPLRDEAVRYAQHLGAAGVDVTLEVHNTMPHGFALMTRLSPAARAAVERIAASAGEALRAHGAGAT